MNKLLDSIFSTGFYETTDGKEIKIHSETSKEQCVFLQKIISENKFSKSLEIGFAFGVSTLAITEAVARNNGSHVVIDKFENTGWNGVGLDLIAKAGFANKIDFHEEYCYNVLPKLLNDGRQFDFAYIDSTKQLDWLLVNFFFIDKVLLKNGIIVFDDVTFPGIRKLLRYISQFPSYKVYGCQPKNQDISFQRKLISILNLLPKSKKYINQSILLNDYTLGINSNCVAIQKIDSDNRNWDWHVDF